MTSTSCRRFLQTVASSAGAAAAMTALPESIRNALAVPAFSRTGTIRDVEHIVVFMQENRSFDHYSGHLRGVRGYNDRFPIPLPGGKPVWYQPSKEDPTKPVLPFHLDTSTTSAQCVGDLDHSWYKTHAAIDGGRYDQWPANKTDMTMGYHLRGDIPFHHALADAFTVYDAYFCSLPGPTYPNRSYLMTDMVDPTGNYGGPLLDNNDFVDGDDPLNNNYGTNILQNFTNYINAQPGSPLYERAQTVHTIDDLKANVLANKLPQVSWLCPPAAYSEHPSYTPAYGAEYTSQILDALTSNPEVWSRTVLFIMYDENDGFFDHIVPPQPATMAAQGQSTVTTEGKIHNVVNPQRGGTYTADGLPYGLGPRVPMTIVSPWSKGGFVCSQVFDHTSVIRFIETRFGVYEPNITAWHRAVCGDLTTAFDFRTPDSKVPPLPDTSNYKNKSIADNQCATQPKPTVPATLSAIDPQEGGIRFARTLPYELYVNGHADEKKNTFEISFGNTRAIRVHTFKCTRRIARTARGATPSKPASR
ncbi:MAG: Phospholipase C (EC [uncultured Paraburkholderia sp.]|nr:MAG: Phospholipase C (EC [uncultured Paraburkholderia sp.]CAH2934145.1 MAG: Phospholipase C (EC [uncultured Paraburkholderia sp.]